MGLNTNEVLFDEVTTAERDAIVNPPKGCTLYNTTTSQLETNVGTPSVPVWEGGSDFGGGGASDQSALVMERTTNYAVTGTPTALTFDTTGTENNPAELEHNDTNKERAEIKTTGLHTITVSLTVENTAAQTKTLGLDLQVSGTPVKSIEIEEQKTSEDTFTRITHVELTAGTYLSVAPHQVGGGTDLTIVGTTILTIKKCSGVTGATGAAGAQGAAGALVHLGAWTASTLINVGDGYEHNGSSYTCYVSHTSAVDIYEPGIGANWEDKWYLQAAKGNAGGGGGAYLRCQNDNGNPEAQSSETYTTTNRKVLIDGSGLTKIQAILRASGGATSAECRIVDKSNGDAVICSGTTTGTGADNIVDLGTLSNLPAGYAVLEVETKRTGGAGSVDIYGVLFE